MPEFSELAEALCPAILLSLSLALCAGLLGIVLSLCFAKLLKNPPFKGIKACIEILSYVVKGLPEILIILSFYYFLHLPAYINGMLALALLFAVYGIEVWMSALEAIPKGQEEASLSLNLRPWEHDYHILLPQLIQKALPGLKNLWLILLKDTALVSQIGLTEIMQTIYEIAPQSHNPTGLYALGALIYIILSFGSEFLIDKKISRK
ncbi:MAG: ABC transporter permease subunit [Gammaproteobacteria bacterium]